VRRLGGGEQPVLHGLDAGPLLRRRVEVVERVVHPVGHERGDLGRVAAVAVAAAPAEPGERDEPHADEEQRGGGSDDLLHGFLLRDGRPERTATVGSMRGAGCPPLFGA